MNLLIAPGRHIPIDEYVHDTTWERLLVDTLGEAWGIERWSYWLVAHPRAGKMPDQGFKIHVSPDYEQIDTQLVSALKVLAKYYCSFKINADMKIVGLMNTKLANRSSSGKYITIYPNSHAQFLDLVKELSSALRDHAGPYVLTDRRVPSSQCLFYRYGGFRRIERQNGDGATVSLIRSQDGVLVEDKRLPLYYLPPGVVDPFVHDTAAVESRSGLLNNRYEVSSAYGFSNGGGVYRALDTLTQQNVVIKEGRPRAGLRLSQDLASDAVSAIKGEASVLERLRDVRGVVPYVEYFEAWEHAFLVEGHIPFNTWYSAFAMDELILVPFTPGQTNVKNFLRLLVPVLRDAVRIISEVHDHGIALGDVSARNILIDPVNKECHLIDLETAYSLTADIKRSWRTELHTPGYRRARDTVTSLTGVIDRKSAILSDWYGLAMCVVEAAMPVTRLAYLKEMSEEDLSDLVTARCGLPLSFKRLLMALFNGETAESLSILDDLQDRFQNHLGKIQEDFSEALERSRLQAKYMRVEQIDVSFIKRISEGLVSNFKGKEADTLWTVDPLGARTNKFSINHGAAGIITAMNRIQPGSVTESILDEMLRGQNFNGIVAERGLYLGSAGIAATQAMRGDVEGALASLPGLASYIPSCSASGLFDGTAGIGLAALSIYMSSGSEKALELADQSFVAVRSAAKFDEEHNHTYWLSRANSVTNPHRDMEKYKGVNPLQVNFGYGNGMAGISYFLAHYYNITGVNEANELAHSSLRTVVDLGCRLDSRGRPQWGVDQVDPRMMPYWFDGAAGIGSALCRIGVLLDEERYIAMATQLVDSAFCTFSVSPGQKSGLAGILEFLTDVYQCTQDPGVLSKRNAAATGLYAYALDAPKGGIAFPGELCQFESFDYATGSAGIGLALHRTLEPNVNPFVDFALPTGRIDRSAIARAKGTSHIDAGSALSV